MFEKKFYMGCKAIMKVIESAMGKKIADKASEQTVKNFGVSLEDQSEKGELL